jgi:hypothetical protein
LLIVNNSSCFVVRPVLADSASSTETPKADIREDWDELADVGPGRIPDLDFADVTFACPAIPTLTTTLPAGIGS